MLASCSADPAADDARPLGEGVTVSAGEGVEMSFSIDDVTEGTAADIKAMGAQVPSVADDRAAYFVTYSVALTNGDIANADSSKLPVPKVEEWTLDGDGKYVPLRVVGSFDCTKGGVGTNGVAPDAPLVACQAFLGAPGKMPSTVEAAGLGTWTTASP